ncbi:MAG: restriction endonuclease [Cardiobacteriaceae bacterium]|nr:restriction endonuclease [Cardiobacteriaceae bacterium]
MQPQHEPNVWIMRVSPGRNKKLQEVLESNQLILGWAKVTGLVPKNVDFKGIKEELGRHYNEENQRRLGSWAGSIYRFIYEMKKDDYVLIPTDKAFYIARLREDNAIYLKDKVEDDSAYRRNIEWLNNKEKIPRNKASAAIQSRLKGRHTVISGYGLSEDLNSLIEEISRGDIKDFYQTLKQDLTKKTLKILRNGKMNPLDFERLIASLLEKMGATILPKGLDYGIDVKAIFKISSLFSVQIAVQAKHFQSKPPVSPDVVEQLITGIHHPSFPTDIPTIAMIVTTGTFTKAVQAACDEYMNREDCECIDFRLIDGEELAGLLVDNGIPLGA